MATVTYERACRRYPGVDGYAVNELNLDVGDGEFMVLVGPSGCGKSTSLRMLAGLEHVDDGRILIGSRDVSHLAPKDRDIAMVFQNYALYPHMTVAENMEFALRIGGMGKEERRARVVEAAELLGLSDYLDRKPKALSGGQRQRVAMGRAIVRHPQVFLMDEPLSNLDAKLRVSTRTQIASLQDRLGITTVYVTHDQVEAMTMGDRVAVMKDGVLQQVDTPLNLYERPANLFVATFIGSPSMNVLEASVSDGVARVGDFEVPVDRSAASRSTDGAINLGIRPEAWQVVAEPGRGALPMRVAAVEKLGAEAYLYGITSRAERPGQEIVVRVDGRTDIAKGSQVHVAARPADLHLFDTTTGLRLSA